MKAKTAMYRQRAIDGQATEFARHPDLKALTLILEYDWSDDEIIFVVPTKWLQTVAKAEFGVDDLDYWLQNEYCSEDSDIIFDLACEQKQIYAFQIL